MGTRWSWWPAAASLLLLSACTSSAPTTPPGPVWRAVTFPGTAAGRPEIRDLAACAGRWWAVGGYLAGDATTPAAWSSVDGQAWSSVTVHPVTAYGPADLLTAAACRGDTLVAVGSAAGGAHGNLRTSTWLGTGGGPLVEVPAPFELFGGTKAIGVGRMTAGPSGWVLTGARQDANGRLGAAVWTSPDGHTFGIVDADPALESDATGTVTAVDATSTNTGYLLVGDVLPGTGTARDPLAWGSADGHAWHRETVPGTAADESLQRVVPFGSGALAVGLRGTGFGAWLVSGGTWRTGGAFGHLSGTGLPLVTGAAVDGGVAYVAGSPGDVFGLWRSRDGSGWSTLAMPAPVPDGPQHLVRLAAMGGHLLMSTEDGTASRLWLA